MRRISAMSNAIKTIDNEMIYFCNHYVLFEFDTAEMLRMNQALLHT